ncbi:TonB-dependent receptor [Xanthocytophaga agilis]|uniref:TonB-dependent receptor n=1 Tax=Xanthocytophaga agilis TaxID=3048010 RepID=A0AAE3R3W1_9BACT|nr:TonB-dependent receptor [Xanthocytophaga agilis]MDJ1500393.1 TonB-dependent receptor [Xanthocytophaga agilis]
MYYDKNLGTRQKALKVNLDRRIYGSFAEIGAGQEVAAQFFKAGGASGTIAKTISAYDMTFSDAIYGVEESGRYVVESRLTKMLHREYNLLQMRLNEKRGAESTFFAFADTVVALNYQKTNEGHGWIGLRFQLQPGAPYNDVIMHVKMLDTENLLQQQALGVVGVNLIYGCYYYYKSPETLLLSLMDDLSPERLEIDMIRFTGPDFVNVDNRLMSLYLVKNGFTNVALFGPDGNVLQPSEALYKRNIVCIRGRFRPVTHVNLDMLENGVKQFLEDPEVNPEKVVVLSELTLHNLKHGQEIDEKDYMDRVNILASLGQTVMISNYQEYYKLVAYLSKITKLKIGLILGMSNLEYIFEEKHYEFLPGGILEAFATLFSRKVKLYVYPMMQPDGKLYSCTDFTLPPNQIDLFEYLLANNKLEAIRDFDENLLHIISDNVLAMIKDGIDGWEIMVPTQVARIIKERNLFGYTSKTHYTNVSEIVAPASENESNDPSFSF